MPYRFLLRGVAIVALAACRLAAQNPTATLVGIVRDPSGAFVSGAQVIFAIRTLSWSRKANADTKGEFTLPDLRPGPYEVTITHNGFRTTRETNILLEMDQVARLEIKLEIGAVAQSVEVIGVGARLVNTDNGTKGQVMTDREIQQVRACPDIVRRTEWGSLSQPSQAFVPRAMPRVPHSKSPLR